jgi:hypothetical protein
MPTVGTVLALARLDARSIERDALPLEEVAADALDALKAPPRAGGACRTRPARADLRAVDGRQHAPVFDAVPCCRSGGVSSDAAHRRGFR